MSLVEADARIRGIWQANRGTARMDSEHDGFKAILAKLHRGELTPQQAVGQANQLAAGRQEGMEG